MASKASSAKIDTVVSLCKRRGFVFPSGEIYGGTRSAWDYGPLGVELKENVKRQWWRSHGHHPRRRGRPRLQRHPAHARPGRPAATSRRSPTRWSSASPATSASGRTTSQEEYAGRHGIADPDTVDINESVPCPNCGNAAHLDRAAPVQHDAQDLPRRRRGRVRAALPAPRDRAGHLPQLRQRRDQRREKPPFGIAQMGKSFRNEITPGNFIFRTREFEQMEMEFFVKPGEDEEWHQYWIDERTRWYTDLGISPDNLRHFEHPQEKLTHYAKRTVDIEYRFGFSGREFEELEGIANRTDFDLTAHSKASGQDLSYFDQASGERYIPYVDRAGARARPRDDGLPPRRLHRGRGAQHQGRRRQARRAQARPAPRAGQGRGAAAEPQRRPVAQGPRPRRRAARHGWNVEFDDSGAIGRRYRRQDEIGTPYCVTVDFDTLDDHAVTVRERDTMSQERIALDQVSVLLRRAPRRLLTGTSAAVLAPASGHVCGHHDTCAAT